MKMTVDFSGQVNKLLNKIAKSEGRSKTEILRRSIGLYSYFHEEMRHNEFNKTLAILDENKKVVKQLKWI